MIPDISGSPTPSGMPFTTCENVQERLIYLRGTLGRKWLEIQSGEFYPVPCGTLYKIMRTGQVPKKWWKVLNIHGSQPPRIAISKVDMESASRTILDNIEPEKVSRLIALLQGEK
jgi:hypothetical protein